MITRAYILEVLEGEINVLEGRGLVTRHESDLYEVLLRLIADLALLEKGEVPPLFVPKKVKARGKRPAKVRELRLKAIGAVIALRKVGCSAQEAIEIVAEAHAVSPETIRHWRKTLGKDTDPEAIMLMALLPYPIFSLKKENLLKAVAHTGQAFKDAQEKKGK
jgi:hypothetical protein